MPGPLTEPEASLPTPIWQSRLVVLVSYYALLGYFLLSSLLYYSRLNLAAIAVWLVQILPLLLFASGLHRNRLRTYAWMCFVILLYFTHGVLVAFDPSRRWLGFLQVALCVNLFVFLLLFIRQYRHHFNVNF